MDDPLVTDDARALIADLTVRRQSVATAESLTGGLLAATLAGVPGASVVLRGETFILPYQHFVTAHFHLAVSRRASPPACAVSQKLPFMSVVVVPLT